LLENARSNVVTTQEGKKAKKTLHPKEAGTGYPNTAAKKWGNVGTAKWPGALHQNQGGDRKQKKTYKILKVRTTKKSRGRTNVG